MTIALVTPLIAVVCGSIFLGEGLLPQTFNWGSFNPWKRRVNSFSKTSQKSNRGFTVKTVDL